MKELVESLEIKRVIVEVDNLRNGNDTFYLWSNQIGVEGAKAITESIKVNKTITYLNLHLEDKITKEIQEYIQRNVNISKGYNPQAEELKIQGNILSNKGEHGKAIEKYNEAITIIKNPLYITNKTNAEKQQAELLAKQQKQEELQFNKLLLAVQNDKLEDAIILIQHSNIQTLSKKTDNDDNTILHIVAQKNIPELYELLIKLAPELVNTINKEDKTALEIFQVQREKQQAEEYMINQRTIIEETMNLVSIGNERITEKSEKGILILNIRKNGSW